MKPRSPAPLPLRNGVAPSYCWLQKGRWSTLLEFLVQQFPEISETIWLERMQRGEVVNEAGQALDQTSAYFWGQRIFYYREIDHETPIPFEAHILYRDDHLLVVDKPHFLPVIPTGRFLNETLLVRLRNKLDLPDLFPAHRLDRETAGVMIFSIQSGDRDAYQGLFRKRSVNKTYLALAGHLPDYHQAFVYRSRMEPGTPFFRMQEVAGPANSETWIEIIERRGACSLYRLKPVTGRKHQLRVHMAALGVPILNDSFYPNVLPVQQDDWSKPLQLLAHSLEFSDPVTGRSHSFESHMRLGRSD